MNIKFYNALAEASGRQSHFATLTDKQIFEQVLQGEAHLFELIMRRHNRRLYRIARGILKDDAESEDVLQESYIRAYTHLKDFNGQDSAGAWLAKITINESIGRWRRLSRPQAQALQYEEDMVHEFPDKTPSPESFANAEKVLWLIESAIERLPGNYRLVFVLRAVEQLSVAETAEYLDINPATVKTRFHRAKSLLQKMLGQQVDDIAPEAFSFGGKSCDGIVERVFKQLADYAF